MKAGALFSAGVMAIAVAALSVPVAAIAAERPERSGEQRGWSGRSNDGGGQRRGPDTTRMRQMGNDPGRRSPPPSRSVEARVRNWGEARASVATPAQPRTETRNSNRPSTWNRGDNAGRDRTPDRVDNGGRDRGDRSPGNPSWSRGDNAGRDRTPDRADNNGRDRTWNRGDNDRNGPAWKRDNDRDGRTWNRGDNDRNRPSWNRGGNDRDRADNDRWRHNDRRDNDWRNDRRPNYRDGDHRSWDRQSWRRDNRYDWRRYRDRNRSVYRIGRYYAPYHGYSYRRLSIGFTLGSMFYGNRYWINDPWGYRLPEVYGPYRWVRYYDDVLLVNVYTGQVVDVIYDFFW